MIKFIHTADIHFGMENYGKIDPATGIHSRLLDFEKALNFCIDTAIDQNVDFFLFSGDAYKTAHPSPTQQRLLMQCFFRLYKAGIPVVIIVGNHDHPLSFGKANSLDVFGQLPIDGFHVVAKPAIITLTTKNGPINIVGIPWPTRNNIALKEEYLYRSTHELTDYIAQTVGSLIHSFAEKLDPSIPAVLAGHLTVANGIFSGSEKRAIYGTDPTLLVSQLAIAPFDYVALGHLHRYQNLNPHGYPAVVYSGSPERVDFGERKEDKGFCLITIHEKNKTDHTFIKTPTRPFIQIEVQLERGKDQTSSILEALALHTLDDAVIKIIYHLPAGVKDMVDLQEIMRTCQKAMHIVGIIPIQPAEERVARSAVHVDMDFKTMLDNYFSEKKEFSERKNQLIDKALQLQHELNTYKEEELP